MATGYDKFFKEAQKATGLSSGTKKPSKTQFQLRDDTPKAKKATSSPEDRLRQELASRMKRKKQAALRQKKNVPLYPMACLGAAIVMCAIGYYKSDALDDWLGKIEIGIFGQARASQAEAKKSDPATPAGGKEAKTSVSETQKKEKPAQTAKPEAASEIPNTKGWTQEELSFFSKLNDRKKELDLREAELGKLEEELQKRKSELDEKLKTLEAMRAEISKTLKSRVAEDQTKVDKLVQFYSSMKPQQAAKVIETLNEDLAVEVLDKLKKKSAAEILDMMNAKKARRLSELLTGYQRTTASIDGAQDGAETENEKTK